jgi:hypothetical protein
LPTGPGSCADNGNADREGACPHWAQSFLPPRGGHLAAARVWLYSNPANYTLACEVRTVDGQGVPTATVLDSATVFHIPATAYTDPPRQVDATFPSPASITLGQRYALAVTGPDDQYYLVAYVYGDFCPDGNLFFDLFANDTFVAIGNADLVYAVTIG